ncbi:hypothetical protein [Bradyrhizobium neotropicale]|uniref:hypothetical protein n=1 Tax=Bradyrhizobium neotropicale TaxID=1497615 RepID=UPI001AD66816|nr:hypothetical protein [Bradyrhizobium neotropicale]MBO4228035.1 hypothetical protein [Bradyrhizobium neotropicale]
MDDIVRRLRDFSIGSSGSLREEAAAEIERLRAETHTHLRLADQRQGKYCDAMAEIESLRSKLATVERETRFAGASAAFNEVADYLDEKGLPVYAAHIRRRASLSEDKGERK